MLWRYLCVSVVVLASCATQLFAQGGTAPFVPVELSLDATEDLVPDELVREPRWNPQEHVVGRVVLRSGTNDSIIIAPFSPESGDFFGFAAVVCPDFNADGINDIAVASPGSDHPAGCFGAVRILSGMDGLVIEEFTGLTAEFFGAGLCIVEDRDEDMIPDLLVRTVAIGPDGQMASGTPGWRVLSGATGAPIQSAMGEPPIDEGGGAELDWHANLDGSFLPGLAADLNSDGTVNQIDLDMMIEAIGEAATGPSPLPHPSADLNRDDEIDAVDLTMLMEVFGRNASELLDGPEWGDCRPGMICCPDPPCLCLEGPNCDNPIGDDDPPTGGDDPPGGGDPPCPGDLDCDGIPDAGDCDTPGNGGGACCGDSDGDGIRDQNDCDSPCYAGDPSACDCGEVDIEITDCPDPPVIAWEPNAEGRMEMDFLAQGTPPGGEYEWTVSGVAHFPAVTVPPTGPVAPIWITEPGHAAITVKYTVEVNGRECEETDTCEFDVIGVDVTIHRPAVLDPAETAAPDADELTVGVQTFVNLDNDDRDEHFDTDQSDTVVAGEDEMCKVVVEVAGSMPQGTLTIEATQVTSAVSAWRQSDKGQPLALPVTLQVPADVQPGGTFTFWLEGIQPHTANQHAIVRGTLEYFSGGQTVSTADEVALTVLGVELVSWLGIDNSVTDADALDNDPNWPAGLSPLGLRVFPDARFVNGAVEANPRDTVRVNVRLTSPPVEPLTVYMRSFDVDDPTADADDVDDESVTEDNRGTTPARVGAFFSQNPSGLGAATFAPLLQGGPIPIDSFVNFRVTMQPGDNFRVAANADPDFLLDLRNDDNAIAAVAGSTNADKQRLISPHVMAGPAGGSPATPAQAEVRDAANYVSPTLAVWRFLHVEVDSMGPVAMNYVEGNITGLQTGGGSGVVRTDVDAILNDGSPDLDDPQPDFGRFENGVLRVADTHDISDLDGNGDDFLEKSAGIDLCAAPLPFKADGTLPQQPPGQPIPIMLTGTIKAIDAGLTLTIGSDWIVIPPGAAPADFVGAEIRIQQNASPQAFGPVMSITGFTAGNSGANPPTQDRFTVSTLRVPFRVVDDDTLGEGGDVPEPDMSLVAVPFAPAYVRPLFDAGIADGNLAFQANVSSATAALRRAPWKFDAQAEEANQLYWCVYILGCFQADTSDDADPNHPAEPPIFGIVDGINGQGANIFTQAFRNEYPANLANGVSEAHTVAHEFGHLFNGLHSDGGLMHQSWQRTSPDFAPITLDKIRGISHP